MLFPAILPFTLSQPPALLCSTFLFCLSHFKIIMREADDDVVVEMEEDGKDEQDENAEGEIKPVAG